LLWYNIFFRLHEFDLNTPLFSIITPCFNDEKKLRYTLDSVLSQSFKNFEFIVVDDASTDNSLKMIEEYAKNDQRIRIVRNEFNKGINFSVKAAALKSRGLYLGMIACGDLYGTGLLSSAAEAIRLDPNLTIWFSKIDIYDPVKGFPPLDIPSFPSQAFDQQSFIKVFREHNLWIHGLSTIIKKDVFLGSGGFPSELGPQSDWYLFHALAFEHGACYCSNILAFIEHDDQSYSRRIHLDRKKRNTNYYQVLNKLYKRENRQHLKQFLKSGLLTSISDTLFWQLLRQPKYWPVLHYSKSSFLKRIAKSLKKKLNLGF
jgi:glycosyltransferase involved in cell wall biosynthesis